MIRRLNSARIAALVLSLATALLASFPAKAQFRTIPAEAKRGVMSHVQEMTVEIDGKRALLAPGAQIRDGRNMAIIPAAVPPGVVIKYLLDSLGQVTRVWILSPQEAAQPDQKH
jgi:hypothetical protein